MFLIIYNVNFIRNAIYDVIASHEFEQIMVVATKYYHIVIMKLIIIPVAINRIKSEQDKIKQIRRKVIIESQLVILEINLLAFIVHVNIVMMINSQLYRTDPKCNPVRINLSQKRHLQSLIPIRSTR